MKEDSVKPLTTFIEQGTWITGDNHQGRRTDLDEVYSMIKDNKPLYEIMDYSPGTFFKFNRAYNLVRNLCIDKIANCYRKIDVTIIYGDAGTGKSKFVHDLCGNDLYCLNDYNNEWWDGYTNETNLLLDDFYGGISLTRLLILLDGYKCRLPVKGSFTYALWNRVFITSNRPPSAWYMKIHPNGLPSSLLRRISKVLEYKSDGTTDEHDVSDFGKEHMTSQMLLEQHNYEFYQ